MSAIPAATERIRPETVVVLGVAATVAQALFLREMLPLFTGSEFVVAVLLGGWLAWTGTGALAGGRLLGRRAGSTAFFRIAALLAGLLIPATVLGIRIVRSAIVVVPGAMPPFQPAIAACLLFPAPFCLLYGFIYNAASRLLAGGGGTAAGVSRAYILEAAGALAGAPLFAFLVAPRMTHVAGAAATTTLVMAAVLPGVSTGGRRIGGIVATLMAGTLLLAASPGLERSTAERLFRPYELERFGSSRYGEIAVVSRDGMRSFFTNGSRLFSVPEPERTDETIHLPLLLHPAPRRVLIAGGALGGGVAAAVAHPTVEAVDVVELDGALLEAAMETARPDRSGTARIDFIVGDARRHLAERRAVYDVVIMNAPPPLTLRANRFFTTGFFQAARRSLRPGGILCCRHSASENFLTRPEKRVLGMLEHTVRRAFGDAMLLPGAWVVAPARDVDPDLIISRLEERGVEADFVSRGFLPFLFSPGRIDWFRESVAEAGKRDVNTDARPLLPLRELAVEGRRIGSPAVAALGDLAGIDPRLPPAAIIVIVTLLFVLARDRKGRSAAAVWGVGFAAFLGQVVILLSFQARSGLLYHGFVLLTALFMAGAAAGAVISSRRGATGTGTLRVLHALAICHAAALAWWVLSPATGTGAAPYLFAATLGAITGAYYPAIVFRARFDRRTPPAFFYAWDLLGACCGAVVGGVLLVPVAGFVGTVMVVGAVHLAAAFLLAGERNG